MNARRVAAAAGVIHSSQVKGKQTAAGVAADLEAACLLQSPESAAELAALRDELRAANEALSDAAEKLRENQSRFETLRSLCDAAEHVGIVSGGWFTVEAVRRAAAGVPLPRPDGITQRIAPTQAAQSEGEHYAFVHHDHRLGHDLPELGGQR